MLRIHDVDHFKEVRDFSEKTERWDDLYSQLKILADFTEVGEPSLDEHRQFHTPYPYDENWPLELTGTDKTRCNLFSDSAPYSFYFEIQILRPYSDMGTVDGNWKQWMNGGLIYHGAHDNGGDGGAPTFSVNVSPVDGWSIHT